MSSTVTEMTDHLTVVTEDGEVLRDEIQTTRERDVQHHRRRTDEPDYVKLYVMAWCEWRGLTGLRDSDKDVLIALLPSMTWADEDQGQIIYLNSALRKRVAAQVGLRSIDNALMRLVKGGVLKRVERGTYQVNPHLVGKGDWTDIKRLRATFEVIGPDAGAVEVETA